MKILGVETSCDDTGIAILETDKKGRPKMLTDLVSSQIKIHAPWGGVVPTLAKREHQKNLTPLLKQALTGSGLLKIKSLTPRLRSGQELKIKKYDSKLKILSKVLEREPKLLKKLLPFLKKYQKPNINLIAVTVGPGLEPALWVGVNFARALSYAWNLPIIPINHIEAHITANFQFPIYKNLFPAVCLVVSGGHTQLILIKKFSRYEIIGETRDDAAGEAFDKAAKMLGLGYPGGPIISKCAQSIDVGYQYNLKLPRPMLDSKNFDFSFSGLKTAVLYLLQKLSPKEVKRLTPAIAAEFQQAVVDVLVSKTLDAAKKYRAKTIMLSGGVAANDLLRQTLSLKAEGLSLNFLAPPKNLCTDNAAMVALTAYFKNKSSAPKNEINWRKITTQANLAIN